MKVAGGDRHAARPASSLSGLPAFEPPGPDLRAAEILQDRHLAAGARRPPRARARTSPLRLVRAVRKIQAEDVGAGGDQRVEHGVGVARRADGRDDLRVAHWSRIAAMGADCAGRHRALSRGTEPRRRSACSTTSRAATRREACRWSTPKSARCCACWRPPSAPRASSRSAPRSATRASGSPARCRRRHAADDGDRRGRARSEARENFARAGSPTASASSSATRS